MKKNVKYLLAVLFGIITISSFSNCGSGKSNTEKSDTETAPVVLKPETTKIKGHLGDCFKVVDKNYKENNDGELTVEIERTEGENELLDKNIDNLTTYSSDAGKCHVDFTIELLDADKNVIETIEAKYDSNVPSLIKNTRPGETGTIKFELNSNNKSQFQSFRLASICELNPEDEEAEDDDIKKAIDDAKEIIEDADLEDAEKALDASVKALEATNEAIKMLNDLQ